MAPLGRARFALSTIIVIAALLPARADAQAPAPDPFLGVPILTTGAPAPGQPLNIDKHGAIFTFLDGQHGIDTPVSGGGYPQNVIDSIQNFSASGFLFSLKSVSKADGTAGAFGAAIAGARTDATGQPIAGTGGSFTLNNDGTFTFSAGTDFADVAPGQKVRSTLTYTIRGTNAGGITKDSVGQLVVEIARADNGTLSATTVGADFADFGPSTQAFGSGKVFVPDLKRYVTGLLRFAAAGTPASGITVTSDASILTLGVGANGILAKSIGEGGPWGRNGNIDHGSDRGGPGGDGGPVSVTADGSITTIRKDSIGVLGWSVGGTGGQGGEGGFWRASSAGGPGAVGGTVTIRGDATINTSGERATGILALSQGGEGGNGGGGATFFGGGSGSAGGRGGPVDVQGSWDITTLGDEARGIWAKSFGGRAGSGGNGGWAGSAPGSGGIGTEGGHVTVVSDGAIKTSGANAYGIFAQSIGGFGGNGGDASNIFYGSGGSGAHAGSGGQVDVTNDVHGSIVTTGAKAHGIFAESVGGGGGAGGGAAALVAVGGSGDDGGAGDAVTVTNKGSINVSGADARGIFAQSVGGGGGDGADSGGAFAVGGSGSHTSPGGTVKVANSGTIAARSDAIFAQSVGGGGGNGGSSIGWFSVGGTGGEGGNAAPVTVSSHGDLTTTGQNGNGIFAQSLGGGGGNGGNSVAVGAFVSVGIGGHGAQGGTGSDVMVGTSVTTGAIDPVTGTISTQKDNANGILAQSVGGGGGNGGFAASLAVGVGGSAALGFGGDGGEGNRAASTSVYFGDADSIIHTAGDNSNGIFAQSVGGGGGSGGFAIAGAVSDKVAVSLAFGGSGGDGADGGIVTVGSVANPLRGSISTTGAHSYGVLAQSVGGGGGNGGMSIAGSVGGKAGAAFSFGGDGGGGGAASNVFVTSQSLVSTQGNDSHGLFAQSVGGGGGSGGAAIAGSISGKESLDLSFGGHGAKGGDAGAVTLTSEGSVIATLGDKSYGILAQSIGGGGGDGGYSVAGSISGDKGINLSIGGDAGKASNGGVVTLVNSSAIVTQGNDAHAIFAQSTGGGGGSGGFAVAGSLAKSDDVQVGIGGRGGKGGNADTVAITNSGAGLQTIGDRSYGVLAQSVGGGGGDGGFSVAAGISKSNSVSLGLGGAGGDGGDGGVVGVTNLTSISTQGELAHGIFAQSVGGGGGSGGFAISGAVSTDKALSIAVGGNGGVAGDAKAVTVINTGDLTTGGDGSGQGSYGILAQSVGGGGGAGGFSGSFAGAFGGKDKKNKSMSFSVGGDGAAGGNSEAVVVTNSGTIVTTAAASIGVYAQSIGGGGGDGGFSLNASLSTSQQGADLGISIGGDGGAAGNGSTLDLTNLAPIVTLGDRSQGIQAQSVGGGGGNGGFSIDANGATGKETKSISVSVGGKGNSGGDASRVTVTNNTSIVTNGADSAGIQAQSLGGGGGNGGFALTGSLAGESGKSLSMTVGGDGGKGGIGGLVEVFGNGANVITTSGDRSYGIQAQSVGGGGGNGGFSAAVALGQGGNDPNKASTSVSISVGGKGGTAGTGGAVNVGNAVTAMRGDITTTGADAAAIQAQSIGGGGGNGGYSFSGAINLAGGKQGPNNDVAIAVGGGGGDGNSGGAVFVNHVGGLLTSGNGAHGIEAQSIGGGGGNGGDARSMTLQLGSKPTDGEKDESNKNKSLSLAIGGNGGGVVSTSSAGTVDVIHVGDITTLGGDAHGIFAQSIGGGGGTGGDGNEGAPDIKGIPVVDLLTKKYDVSGKELKITVGGKGGASGDGNDVRVINTGKIATYGNGGYGVFAQSIGGGGGAGGNGDLGLIGQIAIGGGTDTTGNGKSVTVTLNGAIDTYGSSAHGVFAQSIGGGGGAAGNIDRGFKNYGNVGIGLAFGQSSGTGGDGSTVAVNSAADIFTRGAGSTGILAQSIGGGGGVAGSLGNDLPVLSAMNFAGSVGGTGSGGIVNVTQAGHITTLGAASDGIFAQSAGGQNFGKAVNVTLTSGNIRVSGAESNAIFAQSLGQGGNGNIAVTIANADSIVQGGANTGAAVRFADGLNNTLLNRGTLTNLNGSAGAAIVASTGNDVVNNFGTVTGSIDLGAGANAFNNNAGATLNGGVTVTLGNGNTLTNAGTLSAGGKGIVQTMTLAGNLAQNGAPHWLFDIANSGVSDQIAVNGASQLGAAATSIDLNPVARLDDFTSATLFTTTGNIQGAGFRFGTYSGEMPTGQTFGLVNTGNALQLTRSVSTGSFVWTGEAGNSWNSGFLGGRSNWARSQGSDDYVYGTPGAQTDVLMAASGQTELGDDFTINRLIFANEGLSGGVTLGGTSNNTLTLLARTGQGITITGGSQDTSIGANVVLGNDQSWSNNGTGVLRLSGETITGDGKTLTISGDGNASINSAIRTGNGALIKQGAGLLALNGANTYTGGTTVSGGTLQGNTRSLQGNIIDNAIVNFDQAASGTYAGNISGAGSLTKTNTGTVILAGTNTYTGGTTVTGGALQGNTQSLQGAFANQSAVVFDQSAAGTYAGSMTGAGSLTKIGDGTLVLAGANSYSGGTLVGRGTLQGDSRSLQGDILNQASVVFDQTANGTYAGNMAGAGSLTKTGSGVLVLGGSSSHTGGTTVAAGTLQGNTQSLQGAIVNQGSVVFDQAASGAYLGNMSGAGSLVKQGAGVLALGGTNSYGGGTTVAAGALLGNTNSIQGNTSNQSVVAFEQASNGTFGGVMSGSGALIKQGAGVLALTGANTYSGGTLVSGGTLQGTTRSLQGDILNQSAVVFDQNDAGLYSGNMAGAGSLTKQGTGAINVTGDFSQFTGATTVAGGLLSINGMMGGSLFVGAGGLIGGNGIVPSVTLLGGSTLAPGMSVGVLRVNGDARFSAGSAYRVETEAYGSSDMTFVGGNLLPSGAIVDVRAGGTRRYRPINRYMIAAAGGSVTGTFAGATTNLGYLTPSLQYDGREVFLTLRRNDVDFRAAGTRGNQTAVASVLNRLVPAATGSMADHINNVYDQSDGDALKSLNSMSGIQYQHVARSSLDTAQTFMALSLKRLGVVSRNSGSPIANAGLAINDLAAASSGAAFVGADAADPVSVKGWWLSGLGGLARYSGNDVDAGARVPTHGLALGFDGAVTPDLTLGVSGGEAMPEVLLNGADDHTKSRMLQLGFYGRYRKNASRLDGAVSISNLWNRTWRSISDGVVNPVAGASFGGAAFASQIDYGYSLNLGNGFTLEPAGGLQYGHLRLDGATEAGAGALGLIVPDRRERSRRTLAGGRFGKIFSGPATQFVVEGRASWAHEFSPIRDIRMRFVGDATTGGFDLAAPNQLRDSAVVGFGLAGNRTRHLRIFVNFDGEISGPLNSWNGNVGVTRSW